MAAVRSFPLTSPSQDEVSQERSPSLICLKQILAYFMSCLYAIAPPEAPIQDSQWPASQLPPWLPPAVRCSFSVPPSQWFYFKGWHLLSSLRGYSLSFFSFGEFVAFSQGFALDILFGERFPCLINHVRGCARYPVKCEVKSNEWVEASIENSGILLKVDLGPLGDGESTVGWLYRFVNKLIFKDSWKKMERL